MSLDRSDKAREVYQRLLAMIDRDESAKTTAGAATTGFAPAWLACCAAKGSSTKQASK